MMPNMINDIRALTISKRYSRHVFKLKVRLYATMWLGYQQKDITHEKIEMNTFGR